jgi:hypothetical protein
MVGDTLEVDAEAIALDGEVRWGGWIIHSDCSPLVCGFELTMV